MDGYKTVKIRTSHPSMHAQWAQSPYVGVQCPLTSSICEFPGYLDWLWYPGLSSVLVSIAFPFAFSISRRFSIHSFSPAIESHSCFFFMTDVYAPIGRPYTYSLFR